MDISLKEITCTPRLTSHVSEHVISITCPPAVVSHADDQLMKITWGPTRVAPPCDSLKRVTCSTKIVSQANERLVSNSCSSSDSRRPAHECVSSVASDSSGSWHSAHERVSAASDSCDSREESSLDEHEPCSSRLVSYKTMELTGIESNQNIPRIKTKTDHDLTDHHNDIYKDHISSVTGPVKNGLNLPNQVVNSISLPERYKRKLISCDKEENNNEVTSSVTDTNDDREKDLGTALCWVKQEILKLKEQDRSLMRQFIELRSTIRGLQDRNCSFGSGSDVTNHSGSMTSLDDDARFESSGSKSNSLLRGEDYLGEFRGRTTSLLPPKPSLSLTVRRSRSRECF